MRNSFLQSLGGGEQFYTRENAPVEDGEKQFLLGSGGGDTFYTSRENVPAEDGEKQVFLGSGGGEKVYAREDAPAVKTVFV